jgi:hypothetical protein
MKNQLAKLGREFFYVLNLPATIMFSYLVK